MSNLFKALPCRFKNILSIERREEFNHTVSGEYVSIDGDTIEHQFKDYNVSLRRADIPIPLVALIK